MSTLYIPRGPLTHDELWEYVYTIWGIRIPRQRVCPGHQSPFDAFANAFFAEDPVSVWKASRGFGGKTTLMGVLAATEAVAQGAWITILGGSAAQSLRVNEVVHTECFSAAHAPTHLIARPPTRFETVLTNGGWVRALMASQRSVRGPHPQKLRLDEIDEMDLDILEAAQGQPMNRRGIEAQTVMSSTHQYPDKTMTAMLARAKEKGWPVFEWCWRESSNPVDGWLSEKEVQRKKIEVSSAMWDIEYDLQEPSFEGRAIDPEKVDAAFSFDLGTYEGSIGQRLVFEKPQPGAKYVTAADWAKEKDFTVIRTFRVEPNATWREVAFTRINRLPWPDMIEMLNTRMKEYPGLAVHDATGIGNVVSDYIEGDIEDVVLAGRTRQAIFSEYISAIEGGHLLSPRIKWVYDEHKYVTLDDLFGSGHPPDSFVAGALAWSMRRHFTRATVVPIVSLERGVSIWDAPEKQVDDDWRVSQWRTM